MEDGRGAHSAKPTCVEWKDFFAATYGLSAAPEAPPADEESAAAKSVPPLTEDRIEQKMIEVLLQLGLVDTSAAARFIREGLSRGRSDGGGNAGAG
jgi:hypothetical protein